MVSVPEYGCTRASRSRRRFTKFDSTFIGCAGTRRERLTSTSTEPWRHSQHWAHYSLEDVGPGEVGPGSPVNIFLSRPRENLRYTINCTRTHSAALHTVSQPAGCRGKRHVGQRARRRRGAAQHGADVRSERGLLGHLHGTGGADLARGLELGVRDRGRQRRKAVPRVCTGVNSGSRWSVPPYTGVKHYRGVCRARWHRGSGAPPR